MNNEEATRELLLMLSKDVDKYSPVRMVIAGICFLLMSISFLLGALASTDWALFNVGGEILSPCLRSCFAGILVVTGIQLFVQHKRAKKLRILITSMFSKPEKSPLEG